MNLTKNELVIVKHNSLVEASYKLTLNEQRLLLCCISQLDSRKPLPKDNLFTVTAKEFAKRFCLNEKVAYKELEDASKRLYERDIRTYDGKYHERFRWVYFVKYHDGDGMVTMGFSPHVSPYLTMLHDRFTSYDFNQISGLKRSYSIRLLEFLTQFKSTGKLLIDLDKFNERLGLKGKYKRFSDLKKRVIDPSVKELMEKSNLTIDWKVIKEEHQNKTKKIEFIFSTK